VDMIQTTIHTHLTRQMVLTVSVSQRRDVPKALTLSHTLAMFPSAGQNVNLIPIVQTTHAPKLTTITAMTTGSWNMIMTKF